MAENYGHRLVVTGSSAGGIEALSGVLSRLRKDFPAPIVVAQHLDPRVVSNLATILAKRTELDVVSVTSREKMEPGTVYIVPANRHVEILDGHVAVRTDGGNHPKPSIDLLFATAAQSYGDRLVAVVLSGLGHDGTAGARAVKRNGGTVIIEDPLTATYPAMPSALAPSMVDIIAPLDRIGEELEILLTADVDVVSDARALRELLARIQQTSGVDFTCYKMPTIKRRLARQISGAGMKSLTEYLEFLERTPGEYDRLVANFFITVTEFFRDPELFAALRDTVIPAIVEEARGGTRELRLWSAGCATGEEAYSLAILIAEALGPELEDFNVRIFSTDIDEGSIAFARRGIYPPDAFANVPADLASRYFSRSGDMYEVDKNIRAMTVFGAHDLGQRAPFPRIDLVLCRNVLIYFNKALQQRTLELFAFSLRNGGYLALGKAETTNPLPNYFEVDNPTLRIFRRYGARVTIPPAQIPKAASRPVERSRGTSPPTDVSRDLRRTANERIGAFLMNSSIGFVSVDRHYDILEINNAGRTLLNIHGIALGEDLVHLLPPPASAHLRGVLDGALRSEEPQMGGQEIELLSDDEHRARFVSISAYPNLSGDVTIGAVMLFVIDVTELVERRRVLETRTKEQEEALAALRAEQVAATERYRSLREANSQLSSSNNELRANSDALLIDAEETASASEEIETLNEEMQATNEELETLNEEFQATIEELNTTNDELEARSVELQGLVVAGETRRREALDASIALQAMADTLASPMAAVAKSGEIVAKNDRFRALQSVENAVHIADDKGATIPLPTLLKRAATGEAFSFTYNVVKEDQSQRKYRGNATPLGRNPMNGGLLKLEEIE